MKWKDWDPLMKLSILIWIIGFALIFLGLYGERAGWWNDVGSVMIGMGSVAVAASAPLTLVLGAGRFQLRRVGSAVLETSERMRSVDDRLGVLGTMDTKLDRLETMDTKLDRLETMDTKLDKLDELDVIQAELDVQTGTLKHQTEVLVQIRDALTGGS